MEQFQPRYIDQDELDQYGLPSATEQENIMNLVDGASTLIDDHCGRVAENGNGSLVYSTYEELLSLKVGKRNCVRLSYRPVVAISASVHQDLTVSGSGVDNHFLTNLEENTLKGPDGNLSPLIKVTGSYSYDPMYVQDYFALSPLILNQGPNWTDIPVSDTWIDTATGDIWVPAGLYPAPYKQVIVKYNAGYDPRAMPRSIKFATAAVIKNLVIRGGGFTGLRGYSGAGKMTLNFTPELIDETIDTWLRNYKVVVAR